MEFIIKVKHGDGSGGNLIFDDKEDAIATYKKLEAIYHGTETTLSKATVTES